MHTKKYMLFRGTESRNKERHDDAIMHSCDTTKDNKARVRHIMALQTQVMSLSSVSLELNAGGS